MIKATIKNDDGRTVCLILGLSYTNLDRLRQGQPILINGEEMGLTVDVTIFAGETEQSMQHEIRELIGPETKINIDPKLKS